MTIPWGGVGKQTLVFTPLSPNHGVFGFDGLYAESKLGLESLFHKWHSEGLEEYLSIVGATIGWVRGTNLMVANNIVTQAMEESGCRTFTNAEMAVALGFRLRQNPSAHYGTQKVITNYLSCLRELSARGSEVGRDASTVGGASTNQANITAAKVCHRNQHKEKQQLVRLCGPQHIQNFTKNNKLEKFERTMLFFSN